MAPHFLQASMLRDDLQNLVQHATYMRELLSLSLPDREAMVAEFARQGFFTTIEAELEKAATVIQASATELLNFLSQFPCDPLIYTGEEDTETVLAMLERLMVEHTVRMQPVERGASCG